MVRDPNFGLGLLKDDGPKRRLCLGNIFEKILREMEADAQRDIPQGRRNPKQIFWKNVIPRQ